MFLVGLLQWWYSRGWIGEVGRVGRRLRATAGFFSIGQLVSTLFSPFRQISAAGVSGSAGVQLRAFFDKLISRCIGFVVRSGTIIVGLVALLLQGSLGAVTLVLWFVLPPLPVIGILLFAIGWVPQWM